MSNEKPYMYPPPKVLVAPGKTVSIRSLSEEEQLVEIIFSLEVI
jgi:hypothetical protein